MSTIYGNETRLKRQKATVQPYRHPFRLITDSLVFLYTVSTRSFFDDSFSLSCLPFLHTFTTGCHLPVECRSVSRWTERVNNRIQTIRCFGQQDRKLSRVRRHQIVPAGDAEHDDVGVGKPRQREEAYHDDAELKKSSNIKCKHI